MSDLRSNHHSLIFTLSGFVCIRAMSDLRPIPDITISNLPKSHLSFTQDGSALASKPNSILGGNTPQAGSSSNGRTGNGNRNGKGKAVERVPELDNRPYERELSRREQAAVSCFLPAKSARLLLIYSNLVKPQHRSCGRHCQVPRASYCHR